MAGACARRRRRNPEALAEKKQDPPTGGCSATVWAAARGRRRAVGQHPACREKVSEPSRQTAQGTFRDLDIIATATIRGRSSTTSQAESGLSRWVAKGPTKANGPVDDRGSSAFEPSGSSHRKSYGKPAAALHGARRITNVLRSVARGRTAVRLRLTHHRRRQTGAELTFRMK